MARPPLTAPILGDPSRSDADPYDLHSDLIREEPEILGLEDHLDEMDAILARLGTSLDEGQLSQADSDHGHLSGQVIMALDLHESWSGLLAACLLNGHLVALRSHPLRQHRGRAADLEGVDGNQVDYQLVGHMLQVGHQRHQLRRHGVKHKHQTEPTLS